MRFVKPIDVDAVRSIANKVSRIITVENNARMGGFGSAVAEVLMQERLTGPRLLIHGIPDRFIEHGAPAELNADLRLDPGGIASVVAEFCRLP
jgi:1-deoxy-D-xylulose-5-phosphate synthase